MNVFIYNNIEPEKSPAALQIGIDLTQCVPSKPINLRLQLDFLTTLFLQKASSRPARGLESGEGITDVNKY